MVSDVALSILGGIVILFWIIKATIQAFRSTKQDEKDNDERWGDRWR